MYYFEVHTMLYTVAPEVLWSFSGDIVTFIFLLLSDRTCTTSSAVFNYASALPLFASRGGGGCTRIREHYIYSSIIVTFGGEGGG